MRLSVIVASSGRRTLTRALDSIAPQLRAGDEMLCSVTNDAPWGHAARNEMMPRAHGDALAFLDDDDAYLDGALDAIHSAFDADPHRVHIFRMRYGANSASPGAEIWQRQELAEGQVSTQMIVVPNVRGRLGTWTARYQGDFDFARGTVRLQGEPIWHSQVISLYRP